MNRLAVNASKYFLPIKYPKKNSVKSMLHELSAAMVQNSAWAAKVLDHRQQPHTGGQRSGKRRETRDPEGFRGIISVDDGPPSRESPMKHHLIPLNHLEGYTGPKQQRCYECNVLVSWVCARCSTGTSWVALHPERAQSGQPYGCLKAHRKDPHGNGYKGVHEACTGTSAQSKRRRRVRVVVL